MTASRILSDWRAEARANFSGANNFTVTLNKDTDFEQDLVAVHSLADSESPLRVLDENGVPIARMILSVMDSGAVAGTMKEAVLTCYPGSYGISDELTIGGIPDNARKITFYTRVANYDAIDLGAAE